MIFIYKIMQILSKALGWNDHKLVMIIQSQELSRHYKKIRYQNFEIIAVELFNSAAANPTMLSCFTLWAKVKALADEK
jgi:hypothetical protein